MIYSTLHHTLQLMITNLLILFIILYTLLAKKSIKKHTVTIINDRWRVGGLEGGLRVSRKKTHKKFLKLIKIIFQNLQTDLKQTIPPSTIHNTTKSTNSQQIKIKK